MTRPNTTLSLLVALCLCLSLASAHSKVLLKEVTAITLSQGQYTTGRRSSPVPQMVCTGGSARGKYDIDSMLCFNKGYDGRDVVWQCEAAGIPTAFKLGRVQVSCEGYEYPDDPYVLEGSCGVEYSLEWTEEGKRNGYASSSYSSSSSSSSSSSGGTSWFSYLIFGLIAYFIYSACTGPRNAPSRDGRRGGAGGRHDGGRGGGGGNPPPYGGGDGGTPPPYNSHAPGPNGPGFWSGMMGGGALGYMFGSRNRGYGGGYNRGYGGYNRGFSSGFGSGARSSAPSSSSRTHTSTSYASTSRR